MERRADCERRRVGLERSHQLDEASEGKEEKVTGKLVGKQGA